MRVLCAFFFMKRGAEVQKIFFFEFLFFFRSGECLWIFSSHQTQRNPLTQTLRDDDVERPQGDDTDDDDFYDFYDFFFSATSEKFTPSSSVLPPRLPLLLFVVAAFARRNRIREKSDGRDDDDDVFVFFISPDDDDDDTNTSTSISDYRHE